MARSAIENAVPRGVASRPGTWLYLNEIPVLVLEPDEEGAAAPS